MSVTRKSAKKAAAADEVNEGDSETGAFEPQSLVDERTPASELRAVCEGFLSKRVEMWVSKYPDILEEMGLATWGELKHYAHVEPSEIGDTFRALVAEKAGDDPQLKMSPPIATQLGHIISDLARNSTGTDSPPKSQAGRSGTTGLSNRTQSESDELTRATAMRAMYSSMKNDIVLQMEKGETKPANVAHTLDYISETTKLFVGMEGYSELKATVQMRRETPGLSLQEMLASHSIPDDLLVQFAKQLYAGLTSKYKREVVHRSGCAKKQEIAENMYENGITMAHVLIEISLDLSELEIARKRVQYLAGTAVQANSRAMLSTAFDKFQRDTVELHQLRDLGSVRKTAPTMVYDAGSILLTQYCDIAQTWSHQWQNRPLGEPAEIPQMQYLRQMATKVEHMIRELPDTRMTPMRAQVHTPEVGGTVGRDICRQFRRTGKCSYGDKCKFEHQANPGIVLMVNPIQEHRVEQLQDTLMGLPNIGGTQYYDDPATDAEFHRLYETAKQDVDEDDFEASMDHMKQCMLICVDD